MKTGVAIVGGGLAGLALARHLHRAGVAFELFEARERFGGRIAALDAQGGRVDLGPSWFWPGQPRIAALAEACGLAVFEQYATGALVFEDERGTVHRGMGYASMEGSLRVAGGMVRLVEALVADLPARSLHLSAPVRRVGAEGSVTLADGTRCTAETVVFALPPRVARGLAFDPALAPGQLDALAAIPTWMAGHAKFVAVYDRPFWREEGLSGDAMSRRGPLMEIHDASGPEGTPAALFGFLGLPARVRAGHAAEVEQAALAQLGRIFGPQALAPVATRLQDWAQEPETASELDLDPPRTHPEYGLPEALRGLHEGRIRFAVTELAPEMGGYMEGALAAADHLAGELLAQSAAR